MPTVAVESTTLQHLQTAYDGESNARVRYRLFAVQADLDGYRDVASLFRAAARAEQIHAENHARVIRSLGADPTCHIVPINVHNTATNLRDAIKGEEYERDVMYPEFIAEAKKSRQNAAARTFSYALDAEAEHARLYRAALDNLTAGRSEVTYYICLVCGFTTSDAEIARCTICNNPREKFEVVS
ncbi:Rubrerythrin [Candidatus Koribacter versatilis Ellin345]|uniref:Rubrerythrin n=1 Tax=Koribacter versatilis (strain Ellin345) TaxID=204669 RepID=Q1IN13_KORVE|nr:rubrerythrin family protein [Candidatus Koribacter versatilis]ABF41737.1 Rubrerythrin [Candidatus Koribacter versatilis Ellin345]